MAHELGKRLAAVGVQHKALLRYNSQQNASYCGSKVFLFSVAAGKWEQLSGRSIIFSAIMDPFTRLSSASQPASQPRQVVGQPTSQQASQTGARCNQLEARVRLGHAAIRKNGATLKALAYCNNPYQAHSCLLSLCLPRDSL